MKSLRESLKTGYFHFMTFDGEGMRNPFLANVTTTDGSDGPSKDLIDRALVVNSSCLMEVNEGELFLFSHPFIFFRIYIYLFYSVPYQHFNSVLSRCNTFRWKDQHRFHQQLLFS